MGLLKIILDGGIDIQRHIFVPGDVVRGKVTCEIREEQEKIDGAVIIFKGKINTRIVKGSGNNRSSYSEEIIMFRETRRLFRGSFTMQRQTLEWPFEFTFPTSCRYDRGTESQLFSTVGDGPFAPAGHAPLPPSYTCTEAGFTGHGDASVDYKLKVVLNEGSYRREREKVEYLQLMPLAPGLPLEPKLKSILMAPTYWSSETLREEKQSFKQKMARTFSSDPNLQTPQIWFRSKVQIPETLELQQSSPIALSIQFKRVYPNDPEAPTIILERIAIQLSGRTIFRSSGTFRDADRDLVTEEGSFVAGKLNIPVPLDGSTIYPLADLSLLNFKRNPNFLPDFHTWTISHSHSLSVELSFRHQESGHLFSRPKQEIPFVVLQSPVRPGDRVATSANQLPRYDNVASSSSAPPPSYDYDQAPADEKAPEKCGIQDPPRY